MGNLLTDDVDEALTDFKDQVHRQFEHCFPLKRFRARPKNMAWVIASMLLLMNQRRREWHRFGRSLAWHAFYHRVGYELCLARSNTARDVGE